VSAVEDYAIFMLDPDGVVTSWNEGARRIKGYDAEEIVGEHISTFYTAEDREAGVPETNLERAATEGHVEDEGWRVREDGSRFWADVTITEVRDDDGLLQGFTKVTRDMTERREHEQRLREERDITERILDTVPVSICVVDADGVLVRANRRMLERIDVTESELGTYAVDSWSLYDADGEPIRADQHPGAAPSTPGRRCTTSSARSTSRKPAVGGSRSTPPHSTVVTTTTSGSSSPSTTSPNGRNTNDSSAASATRRRSSCGRRRFPSRSRTPTARR